MEQRAKNKEQRRKKSLLIVPYSLFKTLNLQGCSQGCPVFISFRKKDIFSTTTIVYKILLINFTTLIHKI